MALTVATIQTDFNSFVGDSSTDRITAADRLEYITEAVIWLQEELKNDHQLRTYELSYLDTVNYYLVTTTLADLLDGADLRRVVGLNYFAMAHKSPRELAEDIAQGQVGDDSWAIQRQDDEVLLAINATPLYQAIIIDYMNNTSTESLWEADPTSDATNVRFDPNDSYNGLGGSLAYDIDVSLTGTNRASLLSVDISFDLSTVNNTGVFLLEAFIPSVTNVSSYTIRWGSDSSNYWTSTVTTDIDGNPLADGWQTLAFEWQTATTVGTPDESSVVYFRIDVNYTGSQTDATFFRYDFFRVARPETLTFYYVSFYVGTTSTGTELLKFAATTDIPFFSGKYDQYRKAVAHMAASICYNNLRLKTEAMQEETAATKALDRAKRIFPQSITKEVKSFKIMGNNLARGFGRRRFILNLNP